MDDPSSLRIVKAKYNFKGKNNDELNFKKGDLVVITQPLDSDWWEGTLDGVTGWFPTSYVQEIRFDQLTEEQKQKFSSSRSSGKLTNAGATFRGYHTEVLASMVETESNFVSELESAWNSLIQPISGANILSKEEFSLVSSNYVEILSLHRQFLTALKECAKQALNVRRVGRVFLEHAPAFRTVYEQYASNHPRAVRILHSQRRGAGYTRANDLGRFISERVSTNNGQVNASGTTPADVQMLLPLTTALALPLCRLEKIPLTLRELERHLDEGHFDRGDTQRALALFRQLIADCQELRLLRELELDLANAIVAGLPPSLEATGADPHRLAPGVIFLSPVKLATGTDVVDRLFILYPTRLIILSAEPDLTKLAFEADLPLSHLTADRTLPSPDIEKRFLHSFSLFFRPVVPLASPEEAPINKATASTDCFVVVCSSASLGNRWIELLSPVCEGGKSSGSSNAKTPASPRMVHPTAATTAAVVAAANDENTKQQHRRSTSSGVLQAQGFPHPSFSDNSISDRHSIGKVSAISGRHPPLLSMMCPLACSVGNVPISTMLASGMQSSSTLAALAPASPHPNRKPTILSTAPSASTPLARKRFAIMNAGLVGASVHGQQLISSPDSNIIANGEDQQLMSLVESFVSVPQIVPIGAAQYNMSPSGFNNRDGEVSLVPLPHQQTLHQQNSHSRLVENGHGAITIEPIINVQQRIAAAAGGGTGTSTGNGGVNSRNSSAAARHDLLIAEEEKLLLEELKPLSESQNGAVGALQERTLVDAVYALWDYVAELRGEVARLRTANGQQANDFAADNQQQQQLHAPQLPPPLPIKPALFHQHQQQHHR